MKYQTIKKVWIDLDNSPHILFFKPIIKELEKCGVKIIITARDYAQVYELLDLFNIPHIKIGHHPGKSRFRKIIGTIYRAFELTKAVRKYKPDLALSLGVRAQLIAAKILNIKCLISFDYEYTTEVPFIYPDFAIIPSALKDGNLLHHKSIKFIRFDGIKEDIYVPSFIPDPAIESKLSGVDFKRIIVTIRPPASLAHYFTLHTKELYEELMNYILKSKETTIIITPRTKEQGKEILIKWRREIAQGNIVVLDKIIDGLDLIWKSDLVISGGGTMIREAAALGVPAYSIFGGKLGAVDLYLESQNRLTILRRKDDIYSKIILTKRKTEQISKAKENKTLDFFLDSIQKILSNAH